MLGAHRSSLPMPIGSLRARDLGSTQDSISRHKPTATLTLVTEPSGPAHAAHHPAVRTPVPHTPGSLASYSPSMSHPKIPAPATAATSASVPKLASSASLSKQGASSQRPRAVEFGTGLRSAELYKEDGHLDEVDERKVHCHTLALVRYTFVFIITHILITHIL